VTGAGLALAWWAADAAPTGIWGQPVVLALLALLGVCITAFLGALATIYVKRLNRSVDEATVAKTLAETEKARVEVARTHVEVDKTRVDAHGREVEIARGLLEEIRTELERVRQDQQRTREEQDRMREENDKRHRELADELSRVRGSQDHLQRQLDQHIPWDREAREKLREHIPDFPEPPPLGGGGH
jgi:hypothetical protein